MIIHYIIVLPIVYIYLQRWSFASTCLPLYGFRVYLFSTSLPELCVRRTFAPHACSGASALVCKLAFPFPPAQPGVSFEFALVTVFLPFILLATITFTIMNQEIGGFSGSQLAGET